MVRGNEQLLFPLPNSLLCIGDVGGPAQRPEEEAAYDSSYRSQGSVELKKQNDPLLVRVIPYLVLIGVVENVRLTWLPVKDLVGNTDLALRRFSRNEQCQVAIDDALEDPSVGGDVSPGGQNREQSAVQPRHLL
jgi:hypothetical protein